MTDRKLSHWCVLLFTLAVLSGLQGVVAPIFLLIKGTPIALNRGSEVWSTTFQALSATDAGLLLGIVILPQLAWLYSMVEVALLALDFRRGVLFHHRLTSRFIRLGITMAIASILGSAVLPVIGHVFYARGVVPWLPDMPVFATIDTSLAMAGALSFVVGKVMQRGAELQDSDSLTI